MLKSISIINIMSAAIRNFINNGVPAPAPVRTHMPDPAEIVRDIEPPEPLPEPLKCSVEGKGISAESLEVAWFEKSIDEIKDRSIIFYGPSGSGKTVLIYDIMHKAREYFPRVMVFAPTNREKRDYEGIVPKELIYEEFDLNDIKTIYENQRAAAHAYNTASKPEILVKLFNRVATPVQQQHVVKLETQRKRAEQQIKQVFKKIDVRKSRLEELEEKHRSNLARFYRSVIEPRRDLLQQMHLSQDEILAVKYLNYNPRILVIFDDAMTEIMTLIKKGKQTHDNVILDFFYKGRWAYITHFYAFQDDNGLASEIKKNAFYSIFTSPNVATAFFGRGATNFSKQEKARAGAAIAAVFAEDEEGGQKHRKLVYSRLDTKHPFRYTIATLHDGFNMCSKAVRNYCKKIAKEEEQVEKNNPYLKRFSEF
jgi:hypothetical protein